MNFFSNLIEARLVKRYKRFLSEHELVSGETVVAHCPNTGPMLGLLIKGSKTYLSISQNKNRKLKYTWEIIKIKNTLVGVNTQNANKIFHENLLKKKFSIFSSYNYIYREAKYGNNCRIDFKLQNKEKKTVWIEVKSVTLSRNNFIAEFPDTVTVRGTKQLEQLRLKLNNGDLVYTVYIIQRNDINYFKIAQDIDLLYHNACNENKNIGMNILAFKCNLSKKSITINFCNKVKINYE